MAGWAASSATAEPTLCALVVVSDPVETTTSAHPANEGARRAELLADPED